MPDERKVGIPLGVNLETDEDRAMWPRPIAQSVAAVRSVVRSRRRARHSRPQSGRRGRRSDCNKGRAGSTAHPRRPALQSARPAFPWHLGWAHRTTAHATPRSWGSMANRTRLARHCRGAVSARPAKRIQNPRSACRMHSSHPGSEDSCSARRCRIVPQSTAW